MWKTHAKQDVATWLHVFMTYTYRKNSQRGKKRVDFKDQNKFKVKVYVKKNPIQIKRTLLFSFL